MRWLQYQKAGSKGWRDWGEGKGEEMERIREEKETERQTEKGRDLLSLEEGVSILYVRSKLG